MQAEAALSEFEIDVLRRHDRDMWTYRQLAAHYGSTPGEVSRAFVEARRKRKTLIRNFLRTADPEHKITPTATVYELVETYTTHWNVYLQRQCASSNLFTDEAYHHAIEVCNEIYLQFFEASVATVSKALSLETPLL